MFLYKEPRYFNGYYSFLRTLNLSHETINIKAQWRSDWESNSLKFVYRGTDYKSEYKDSVIIIKDILNNADLFAIWWPFERPFYGGLIDLASGVAYSMYDSSGNTLTYPEIANIKWIAGGYSPYEEDYSEEPLTNPLVSPGNSRVDVMMYVSSGTMQTLETASVQFNYRTHTEVDMNIITGYRGEPHITAAQDRAQNQGCFGEDSYILDVGSKLAATAYSATEIHVADGVLSHQGCVGVIDSGTYDVVEIDGGTQGYKRIDLIVCRYEKSSVTYEESLTIMAIKGTPTTGSTPSVPSYTSGDIQGGDLIVDMPLFEVLIEGVSISSITQVASGVMTQAELETAVTAAQAELNKISPFKRVAYHSNGSSTSATYTDTLTSGYSYIAIVGRSNSTSAGQNGFYLIRVHSSNSSVLAVASSSIATVSISGTTLTTVLSSAYATISVYMV